MAHFPGAAARERTAGVAHESRPLPRILLASVFRGGMQVGARVRRVEHLDAVLLQVAEQILRLLAGELHVLERRRERRRREEPALLALGDHSLQLLQLHHRCLGGYQLTLQHLAHSEPPGPRLHAASAAALRPPQTYAKPPLRCVRGIASSPEPHAAPRADRLHIPKAPREPSAE